MSKTRYGHHQYELHRLDNEGKPTKFIRCVSALTPEDALKTISLRRRTRVGARQKGTTTVHRLIGE